MHSSPEESASSAGSAPSTGEQAREAGSLDMMKPIARNPVRVAHVGHGSGWIR